MRNFIIGFILGVTFVGIAWAAQSVVWVDGGGTAMGTTTNLANIQGV